MARKTLRSKLRLGCQVAFTALSNGYVQGFFQGKIYSGPTKYACVPGLNCYSCPGALGSCPIGSLQAVIGSRKFHLSLYVLGFLMMVGAILGKAVCGFLCPFGLVQDLLHKIPGVKKLRRLPGEKYLQWLRYVMLGLLVILLPMVVVDIVGQGSPWFCKYVCPSGTLLGGIPLLAGNPALRGAVGWLFTWKIAILVVILVLSVFLYRPFCRYLCPLGAVYGFFNRFALYRFTLNEEQCTHCGACHQVCGLDIDPSKTPNHSQCIRCGKCLDACPHGAICSTWQKKKDKKS
ncbi:MAG TPA: 4Fe-4S binding protein [Candidatus Avoscillospira avistercoris]|uniref:4Fe-4S binding protein n=1 Tax=Candidatus Avoscillospira avistercoris TaxID=2840707 RepID=A0A9D1F8X6_9FIRM|nr:4Fe-4S binding protein [Candidatus Avoscillospira avistercoris]